MVSSNLSRFEDWRRGWSESFFQNEWHYVALSVLHLLLIWPQKWCVRLFELQALRIILEGLRCNACWRTVVLAGPSLNHAIMAWCPSHTLLAREWSQCSCKPARNAGTAVASKCASLQCQHCSSGTSSRLASSPFLLENDGGPPGEKRYDYLQHMHDNLHQSHRVAEIPGLVRGHEPFGGLQGQIHLQCNHQGVWADDAVAIGFVFNAGHARAQRHTGWGDLQCHHYQSEGKVGVLASNMRTCRLV